MSENVDPLEIEKFEQVAARWWDLEGEFKPLHKINPLRLGFIADHANGLFGKRVCDVGCGGGILTESMAQSGALATGIDMGEAPLQVAKLHSLETGVSVEYKKIPAETYAEQNTATFDIVTCMEMLEHVPEPQSIVQACADMCKPGGLVFFSTLNRNVKSYLMAIIGAEKVMKLVPDGTHDHQKFIKPSELLKFADNAGLKARDITGLHMNPLSQSFYLSDTNVDVNYLVMCEKV